MIYLIKDTRDKDYLVTECTADGTIYDYNAPESSTPDGIGWSYVLLPSNELTRTEDDVTGSFTDWLKEDEILVIETFNTIQTYDKYVADHPELLI